MQAAVTYLDRRAEAWHEGVLRVVGGRVVLSAGAPEPGMRRLDGVVTGGFTDAHVHLQLIDVPLLASSTLGRVIDCGGNPAVLAEPDQLTQGGAVHNSGVLTRTRRPQAESDPVREEAPELCAAGRVEYTYAGAFLTPPGGYPSDRDWAPDGSVREIDDADAAAAAISEMTQAGASFLKVASNSAAGPVFSDALLRAIVELAAAENLPVMVHAEGPGEAMRAARMRAHLLAHAPFTERLTDQDLHRMHGTLAWVSTLAIHEGEAYDVAVDNVRRFRAIGGNVRYGTDMGNGPTPVGLNPREITALRDAGIGGADLLKSLAPVDPLHPESRLNYFPGDSPQSADPLRARPLTPADLEA